MKKDFFPTVQRDGDLSITTGGISLREYYAGQALAGLLMNDNRGGTPKQFSSDAVAYADALIAELEGGK